MASRSLAFASDWPDTTAFTKYSQFAACKELVAKTNKEKWPVGTVASPAPVLDKKRKQATTNTAKTKERPKKITKRKVEEDRVVEQEEEEEEQETSEAEDQELEALLEATLTDDSPKKPGRQQQQQRMQRRPSRGARNRGPRPGSVSRPAQTNETAQKESNKPSTSKPAVKRQRTRPKKWTSDLDNVQHIATISRTEYTAGLYEEL